MKRKPGEPSPDERVSSDSLNGYQVHSFNVIMERVIHSPDSRYTVHTRFYKHLARSIRSNFNDIVTTGLPENALKGILTILRD